jgi:hypothetical protein
MSRRHLKIKYSPINGNAPQLPRSDDSAQADRNRSSNTLIALVRLIARCAARDVIADGQQEG